MENFTFISFFLRFFFAKYLTHDSVPNHYSTNTSAASLMKPCTSTAKQEKRRVAIVAQILHPFPCSRGNSLLNFYVKEDEFRYFRERL